MAKQVVIELEEGDLVRKELTIISDITEKLKSQVTIQDQIIKTKDLKIQNLELIIVEKDKIISICNEEKTIIQGKVKRSFVGGTLVGIGIGALTILLL
jgi:F0F1-type ATP synthase assembly protein I